MLKQRKIGSIPGMVKILLGNLSPYASWLSLALIGVTSFYTTINPIFFSYGVSLPFWMFSVTLALILLLAALLEWMYMLLSYYRANNEQAWDAGGPLQDALGRMEQEQSKQSRELAEIRKMMDKLSCQMK